MRRAATVIALGNGSRDRELRVLMVRRGPRMVFHPGSWAFPGGAVDPSDYVERKHHEASPLFALEAEARRAAVREFAEETGVAIEADGLALMAHWTTPANKPRRFSTWFYLLPLDIRTPIQLQRSELDAYAWLRPAAALDSAARGHLVLPPPTYVTLQLLARARTLRQALEDCTERGVLCYQPRPVSTQEGLVSLYAGDDAFVRGVAELDAVKHKHRLDMRTRPWRYECTRDD